jgi:hypothetical protein
MVPILQRMLTICFEAITNDFTVGPSDASTAREYRHYVNVVTDGTVKLCEIAVGLSSPNSSFCNAIIAQVSNIYYPVTTDLRPMVSANISTPAAGK